LLRLQELFINFWKNHTNYINPHQNNITPHLSYYQYTHLFLFTMFDLNILIMSNFRRNHEINIWELQFRHSKPFRFKNNHQKTLFENTIILNLEPHVYLSYNDEYNQETLKIRLSWMVFIFINSILFLLFAGFFLQIPIISCLLCGLSMVSFAVGVILKQSANKLAYNIDFTKEMITRDVIIATREIIQNQWDRVDS